jgi:hypothetical protein
MPEIKHYTQPEAAAEVERLNAEFRTLPVYCPLMNAHCRSDCVCFSMARVRIDHAVKGSEAIYIVQDGHCGNVMFFGDD